MRLLCLSTLIFIACASTAFAQGNDLDAPVGGRSTLMGGTGVALGRDGSAPFANPATIVRIQDEKLTFSVHFYSLALTHFNDWHQPGTVDTAQFGSGNLGGTGMLETNFRTLPSTLCLFFTLEELAALSVGGKDAPPADTKQPTGKKLGICFATLESEDVDMQAIRFNANTMAGPSTQVQSLQRRWIRTYVGPTYSVSLNSRLAIGASLQVVYSYDSFGVASNSLSARAGGGGISSGLGTGGSGRSFDLVGVLGATYRVDRTTFGVSLRPPSLHIAGSYSGTFNQSYTGEQDVSVVADANGSFSTAPPTRVALGVGVAWDRLTLEANGALALPLQRALKANLDVHTNTLSADGVDRVDSTASYAIRQHVTFNPSVGMEYFITPSLSVLSGLSANFTSLGALKPLSSVGNLIQARMSHISLSGGVGSYWDGGELLFGLQADYGWGQALAVNPYVLPNDWSVIGTQAYSLLFVISGSTNLKSIVRVVNTIANGGEPAPTDKPAQTADGIPAAGGGKDKQPAPKR